MVGSHQPGAAGWVCLVARQLPLRAWPGGAAHTHACERMVGSKEARELMRGHEGMGER